MGNLSTVKSVVAILAWCLSSEPLVAQPPVVGDISPVEHEVHAELDSTAPMRDGVELMVDIYRPVGDGKFRRLST